ncbi:MAG: hypothetical protein ACRD3T_18635 [Terriglobia bacterium]
MNLLNSSMVVLAQMATSAAAVAAVRRWRSRVERADAGKPFQQEWEESGWRSLHRGEFQLCRIVPIEDRLQAEFIVQDERRAELGRFRGRSGTAVTIEYVARQGREMISSRPMANGPMQRASKQSIQIRDENQLMAEAFRQAGLSRTFYRLLWQQQEFRIEKRKWLTRGTSFVRRDAELIGVFRRTAGLSRKTLLALRNDLPEELKVCLGAIAVLEWT